MKESSSDEDKKALITFQLEVRALQQKSINVGNELKNLKQSAKAKIQIGDLLKAKESSPTGQQLDVLSAAKNTFDKKIKNLAVELEDQDIAFDPSETGHPSRAVDKARKEAYASQFFEGDEWALKVNRKGVIAILISIGILEP